MTAKEDISSASSPVDEPEPVVTLKTWLVCGILSLGYGFSFWPVPAMSAIGAQLSIAFEEPTGYIWFIPAWTIAITCAFLIFGPMSDLFGRRWFLVGGSLICTVGHIVVASAHTSNRITVGLAISGFGAANCQMAAFSLAELLPNKWRHIAVVIADLAVFFAVIIAPVTARYGFEFGTWAWNFWALAIFQGLSFVGLLCLYFPPKHPYDDSMHLTDVNLADHDRDSNGISYLEAFKSLDYVGAFLFTGGAVPFLVAIVWAGVYASNDPHVVAPLVIGAFVLVCFGLWETFARLKYPLTPTHVFTSGRGRDLSAPALALAVVNMFYYSSSILWPQITTAFYTDGGQDWKYAVVLSLVQGFPIPLGALLLSVFGSHLRRWNWQLTGSVFIMVLFGSLLGLVTPTNKRTMIAFLFLSQTAYGWAIYLSIAMTQMGVDQKNLGVSGGICCVRFAAGAVATTIYQTGYSTSLTKYTNQYVHVAVTGAGLSSAKVSDLMGLLAQQDPARMVDSFGAAVASAATGAVDRAYCKAIFTVAMVSMAFGVLGIAACLYCKDVDDKMDNKIEVYLENTELAENNEYH